MRIEKENVKKRMRKKRRKRKREESRTRSGREIFPFTLINYLAEQSQFAYARDRQ